MENEMRKVSQGLEANQLVGLDNVRTRLAWIWLSGSGLIFLLLAAQSLVHVYDPMTPDAWGWLLPTLMPSVGLIFTVLTYTALDPFMSGAVVRKTFVPISMGLSSFYLALVLLTILIQPFVSHTAAERLALMKTSNLWLGPLQGLVASVLGALFVSKERSKELKSENEP